MHFTARTLLAVFMVAAAWALGTPQAMAQKTATAKCPETGVIGTLKIPTDHGADLDVTGTCNVTTPGKYQFGKVKVKSGGRLVFAETNVTTVPIEFQATSIVVQTGGTVQAGTEAAPIGTKAITVEPGKLEIPSRIVFRFTGDKPGTRVMSDDCSVVDKGIAVMSGGTLRLYGAKGIPRSGGVSWTHLAAPAGPAQFEKSQPTAAGIERPVADGSNGLTLQLALDVSIGPGKWKPGDWIVVAGTSFSPFEGEFVQIDTVATNGTGSLVKLKTPLKNYHFGGADPGLAADAASPAAASASYALGNDKNYGVDERAEVGLITRSIKMTADTVDGYPVGNRANANRNWGGESKVCAGFTEASIEGVEIEKFGKEALGSYPIHFHMAGDVKAPQVQRVNANSIHHSFNKCVTMHATSDIAFEANVCARITGHVFYQEIGTEYRIRFTNNLGVGAMDNNFGLDPTADLTKVKGWWEGDYLAPAIGFTGLDIRNWDNQSNPTHGQCYRKDPNNAGALMLALQPYPPPPPPEPQTVVYPCADQSPAAEIYYVEPPTGFWIINASAILEGNSIAGCQGVGRGYWYAPPQSGELQFQRIGKFRNNRAHGCYDGIFSENEAPVVTQSLFPKTGDNAGGYNVIARFEGFTATRIRNRAIWLRPLWFAFENARVATSREGVSLVTSGGADGNAPGVWGLLKYGVVIGLSTNNVDRWGPCADQNRNTVEFTGCVDHNPYANFLLATKAYPSPAWNFAGFYIYDGPVRIHDSKFVRFRRELTEVQVNNVVTQKSLITAADALVLSKFTGYYRLPLDPPSLVRKYEGDAALGWFQSNVSTYPIGTETRGLEFVETDLRHQIFTEKVNFGAFVDGDKNTAVIDRDGTLTGFKVVDSAGNPVSHEHPVSLNNLPFNSASNAVDECHSQGVQDDLTENRPTSLITPGNMGTLEFGALSLPNGDKPQTTNQFITFTKDAVDYGTHQIMKLQGRNNQGIWEPKLTHGLGYTAFASAGIPKLLNIGLTDIVKPGISAAKPFYVRLGVCYWDKKTNKPPQTPKFTVYRGYKSWAGGAVNYDDPKMRVYYNQLFNLWSRSKPENAQYCHNLELQTPQNLLEHGCPADGVVINTAGASCAPGTAGTDLRGQPVCTYPYEQVAEEPDFTKLANSDGTPNGNKFHYDPATGMLYLYLVQNVPNAVGSSPLGSCDPATLATLPGNPAPDVACPKNNDPTFPENYYNCPAAGCPMYTIDMEDRTYDPGPSACGGSATDTTALYTLQPKYVLPEPANANKLAYLAGGTVVADEWNGPTPMANGQPVYAPPKENFFHRVPKVTPVCTGTP